MKRSVVVLALALASVIALAGAPSSAHADEDPNPAVSDPPPEAPPIPSTPPGARPSPGAQASDQADAPSVDPSLLSERHMRHPEILTARPSGFWTSNRPAIGGAYRYRLMLLGVAIAAMMATIMIVVIRRFGRRTA